MPPAPTAQTAAGIAICGFFLLVILLQIVIVRWLFRVNRILDQLTAHTKILQDLRTQTWHTRRACETLAGIATDADQPR